MGAEGKQNRQRDVYDCIAQKDCSLFAKIREAVAALQREHVHLKDARSRIEDVLATVPFHRYDEPDGSIVYDFGSASGANLVVETRYSRIHCRVTFQYAHTPA